MQDKFRLYRRRNGMFYADEYQTRHRESLQTKDEAEARRLIAAKNQAATQPVFNLEMAKVYLKPVFDSFENAVSDNQRLTSAQGSVGTTSGSGGERDAQAISWRTGGRATSAARMA